MSAESRAVLVGLALVSLLLGCAMAREAAMEPAYEPQGSIAAESEARMAGAAPASRAAGSPQPAPAPGVESMSIAAPDEAAQPVEPAEGERLRVYSGTLEMVVADVEGTSERIIDLVQLHQGYVESSSPGRLVLRVPADSFEEMMGLIGKLGEIRSRAVQSADVTDQYTDLQKRIEVSERTRDRLYRLLQRTTDARERVAILREIRRLTEEIERLRASLSALAEQVRYSRITVSLLARIEEGSVDRREIPFPWIARLDPLEITTGQSEEPLTIPPPDGFAILSEGRFFSVESAEGTRIRIGVVSNDPRGDARFWQKALVFHLGPRFRSVDQVESGMFRGALFTSKDTKPFYYLVAVSERDETLVIAEVFFPDTAARDRRYEQTLSLLGEVRW